MTLAWAGERLGMNRWQAIEWYTSHGFSYPDYREEDLEHDLKYAESRLGRS